MADESPRRHCASHLWIRTFWRGWVIFQMKKTTDLELRITTKNRKYSISSEPKEFICLNLFLKVLMKTTAVVVVHSTTEPIYLHTPITHHTHTHIHTPITMIVNKCKKCRGEGIFFRIPNSKLLYV